MRNHDPLDVDRIRLVQLIGTQDTYVPSATYHNIRDHRIAGVRHPHTRKLYD